MGRLRRKAWIKDEILGYTDYLVVEPEQNKGIWSRVFNNTNPIYAEFGTGRGQFITTLAKMNPERNYIAMELREEVLIKAVKKAADQGLTNIRFILGNVDDILKIFEENELSRIYLNFVDPWPKKRHAKRRLTHHHYLNMYKHILVEKGEIHFKSDNELLFEFSLNELIHHGLKLKNISLNLYREEGNIEQHVQTEYEEMFIKRGKPIFRLEANF